MAGRQGWRAAALVLGLGAVGILSLRARPAASKGAGAVTGEVTISEPGLFGTSPRADRSGVVVYLENVTGGARPTSPPAIRQHNTTFLPRVAVVRVGATVEFPNDDRIFHNVFSLSQVAKFDLGLYKAGSSRSVTFNRAGVVDIYCNIHPDMVATIKVVDTSAFAITGPDGRFRIGDLPEGTYPFVAWLRDGDEQRGSVTVRAGETVTVPIALTARKTAVRHLRKDGTPYGRYQ
jgi:plastocyanin